MKIIIFLSFILCFSAFAEERCAVGKPVCILAITHMSGEQQTLKNFYISSFKQLSDDYSAVILNDNGPRDQSGLFLVDKNMNHYLTLDILPSHRGHDYFYQITSYGKTFVVVKGKGGYGYSVDGEVKYEIDFNSKKVDKFKLEVVHVASIYKYGEFLYFNLTGKGLKNKIIQFYKNDENEKGLSFSFVDLSEKDREQFKKITSYTKNETKNIKHENTTIKINRKRIDNNALPQPNLFEFKRYRRLDKDTLGALELGYVGFENEIGPYLIKNNKIIFGLSFYDGEGSTGIGGIGFYDIRNGIYDIQYIKGIANKSIDKMFFYKDELWCALYQGGEGAKYHSGILKYNIDSKEYHIYDIPGKVDVIVTWKDSVFINTSKGFYQINNEIKKGIFNTSSKGDYVLKF